MFDNFIYYRSLGIEQLYIYDIDEKPVSRVQMIKYCLWDKQERFGVKSNNIFMIFISEESFKAYEDVSYFIKLLCKSFSYCFLDLYGHIYEKNKQYGVESKSFNCIEDFFTYKKEKILMKVLNESVSYSEYDGKFYIDDPDIIDYPLGRNIPDGHSWLVCLYNGDTKIVETSWEGKLHSPDNKFDLTKYIASIGIHKIISL